MDPIILSVAFVLGYAAHRLGLPPLAGFLAAGFALKAYGLGSTPMLEAISDAGVTLLLFTIGLKLKIRQMLRPEVWAGTAIYMALTVAALGFAFFGLAWGGLRFFAGLDLATSLLLAFAVSFSSTVFAVKILEETGRINSLNGRTAIGILIVQDLLAVIFLTFSTGQMPSWWALLLIALLPAARLVFNFMLDRAGHGELLVLLGMVLALTAGAYCFQLAGMKPDLGALVLGALMASHPRSKEMADQLMGIKDLMLVGFFLSIGLTGLPDLNGFMAAGLLLLALPLKLVLYFVVLTRFRLRARSAFAATMNLANFSEFGLIVGAMAAAGGQLDQRWLVVLAIALSASFVIAAPLNKYADRIYQSLGGLLKKSETGSHHTEERPFKLGPWKVAVLGMGRAGVGAYDMFSEKLGKNILGIDYNPEIVDRLSKQGRNLSLNDVNNPDFWRRLPRLNQELKLVVLAIPNLECMLFVVRMLREKGFQGQVAAITRYDDEIEALREEGVRHAFNVYSEAGLGLAAHMSDSLESLKE